MLNSENRRTGRRVAMLATLLCVPLLASATDAVPSSSTESTWYSWARLSPVGVWRMQVTFTACDTGAVLRAPFPTLNTFYADGNISEVGSGLGPAFRSVSHGRWAWTGKRKLAITSVIELFDANFIYFADQVFNRRFEISRDGKTMTGKASYVRYAPDGSILFQGCATEEGTRQEWPED